MSAKSSNQQSALPREAPRPFLIQPATNPEDLADVASLFEAYAKSLNIDLSFQDFTTELSKLPGRYGPPSGTLLLARHKDTNKAIGCIGLRSLDTDGVCEIKRLYVAPAGRGSGLGKALVEQVIEEAKRIGYRFMRLDTLGSMREAQGLYERLGFVEIKAYYDTPIEGTVFLELDLA
ncbi:acetyltransferase [Aureobasidium namibiae CBS 147.97]|uniref:Acetyltransferase n=1 Tax=Aureobasidium namibiae CBS 147.97 TaxID=1043004 RepID=A0A074WM93_9PEZI|nr:acetyltransferase [Aureobasidium namibiae CBS 147.97]KEQ72704.1 acetyltransferase [Aureobasidium namibiae CBS 147.97]